MSVCPIAFIMANGSAPALAIRSALYASMLRTSMSLASPLKKGLRWARIAITRSRGTEKVLLVEDEDTLRALCERILGGLGYQVMQARNGDEALALSMGYKERIDLLLTDVVMPGMNGRELATQLLLLHPETRVLFTSGYTENAIVHHGVLDEGVSFIGKPYTPSVLARKVREVLDKA